MSLETPAFAVAGRDAPPRSGAMVEALRGLGYSAATALADIIDNSIAAGAREVRLQFDWNGSASRITILDNGRGMDADGLDRAMRLGDRDPLEARASTDLGRFGLGLKTASFSQCRRLTVASRTQGELPVALHWDLDILRDDPHGRWRLLDGFPARTADEAGQLDGAESGTLVIWDKMDRLTPPGLSEQAFLDRIDRIERHLAMVFHRYIEQRRLVIRINGRAVAPWDPFLENRPDTYRSGTDRFVVNGSPVSMEGFVLPHRDRLDPKIYETAAGPDGWTAQQGFYVYRNERLLVAGHWLGLGQPRAWAKDEPFRLARIRIDLTNTADADWTIDIRKSRARPPLEARQRLQTFAGDIKERARRVFAHRGAPRSSSDRSPVVQAWTSERLKGGIRYRIDPAHPAVAAVIEQAGPLAGDIQAMLRVIEATVPVQQIWLDTAEARDTPRPAETSAPPEEIKAMLEVMFRNLVGRRGLEPAAARDRLLHTEPFNAWPDLVAALASPAPE